MPKRREQQFNFAANFPFIGTAARAASGRWALGVVGGGRKGEGGEKMEGRWRESGGWREDGRKVESNCGRWSRGWSEGGKLWRAADEE